MKSGARVLFPNDYIELRKHMPPYYQILCDAALLSGMRPVELSRFQPSWYRGSRRVVVLPKGACLKEKCEYQDRTIRLSLAGCDAFDRLVSEKVRYKGKDIFAYERIPKRVAFRDALRRYATLAGLGTEGITPKMFRKTLVSWLVECYPEKQAFIQASMGHVQDTIVKNYLGIGFSRSDIELIRSKFLNEWGVLV